MSYWNLEAGKKVKSVGIRTKGVSLDTAKHQTGKTNKSLDEPRSALLPGKRMSRTGKIYYEYRKNRSDMPGKKV